MRVPWGLGAARRPSAAAGAAARRAAPSARSHIADPGPPPTPGPLSPRCLPLPGRGHPVCPLSALLGAPASSLPALGQTERKVLKNADCTVAGAMEKDRGGAHGNRGESQGEKNAFCRSLTVARGMSHRMDSYLLGTLM